MYDILCQTANESVLDVSIYVFQLVAHIQSNFVAICLAQGFSIAGDLTLGLNGFCARSGFSMSVRKCVW